MIEVADSQSPGVELEAAEASNVPPMADFQPEQFKKASIPLAPISKKGKV